MAIRPVGKTHAFSVANTSHTAVTVGAEVSDYCNKAAFLNTGTTVIACRLKNMQPGSSDGAPAAIFPADGTPAEANIVLPALMTQPIVFAVPECPFSITAIGSAAGPGIIYVTPCEE